MVPPAEAEGFAEVLPQGIGVESDRRGKHADQIAETHNF